MGRGRWFSSGRKPESRSEGKRGREVAGPSYTIVFYSSIKSSLTRGVPEMIATTSTAPTASNQFATLDSDRIELDFDEQ